VFSDVFFFIGGFYFKSINKSCNNISSFMALAYQVYQLLSNTELGLIVISTIVKRVRPLVKSLGLIIEAFLIKLMRRSVKNYYFLACEIFGRLLLACMPISRAELLLHLRSL
jgi:hypothetical protein